MKNFQFYTICSLTFIIEPCASGFTVSDHMIKPDVMEKQSNSCPISPKYIIYNETYNNVCDAHTVPVYSQIFISKSQQQQQQSDDCL